uniref:Carbonic anhydrase 4 n=1 Tax=Calidris pygmaea TaxID=425635 RepID=A0A8C3JJD3_9CHAR
QSQKSHQPHCKGIAKQFIFPIASSPINIVSKNAVYDKNLKPLNFEGYDVKGTSKWNIANNGHTVKVTLGTSPKIGGGGLEKKYKAIELHWHWGTEDSPHYLPGSEHSIDGEKQAMEVGESVCGNVTNTCSHTRYKQYFLMACLGQTEQMEPLPLSSLLPPEKELGKYYRYEGSLTTPDCHEGVIWTIFEKPIELSSLQISEFSKVYFDGQNSTQMIENFRPVQFLNERKVYWSSASTHLPTAKVLMLVLMLTFILSSLCQ